MLFIAVLFEVQCPAVYTILPDSRICSVIEQLAQVPAASAAVHEGSDRAKAPLRHEFYAPSDCPREAGPSCPKLSFVPCKKDYVAAPRASEVHFFVVIQKNTFVARLCPFPIGGIVLLCVERSFRPFFFLVSHLQDPPFIQIRALVFVYSGFLFPVCGLQEL